jgi:hypothetical protein
MENLWIVLTLVASAVGMTWFVNKEWKQTILRRERMETQREKNKLFIPLKLSAIERLTIMLERTKPTHLILRQPVNQISATQLQHELMKNIREEYDHNMGLQIYVHASTWKSIDLAKESTIELIKVAFQHVGLEANAMELSSTIFQLEAETQNSVIQIALDKLKEETAQLL